jgi:hypothetical protein
MEMSSLPTTLMSRSDVEGGLAAGEPGRGRQATWRWRR